MIIQSLSLKYYSPRAFVSFSDSSWVFRRLYYYETRNGETLLQLTAGILGWSRATARWSCQPQPMEIFFLLLSYFGWELALACHLFTATDPHDLLTSQGGSQFNESDFPILQFMLNWRGTWLNPVPLGTGLRLNYFSYGQATASIAYHWPASSLLSNSFFTAE